MSEGVISAQTVYAYTEAGRRLHKVYRPQFGGPKTSCMGHPVREGAVHKIDPQGEPLCRHCFSLAERIGLEY